MGRGDKKTKKGKIAQGSYGVTRQRKPSNDQTVAVDPPKKVKKPVEKAEAKEKKPAAKKAETKKAEK
jgi:ribosomal small subunit protein bTHX